MLTSAPAWAEGSPLLQLAESIRESNATERTSPYHQVGILDDGFESFVYRVHLVRNAKRTIDIQTFIWADEATSSFFQRELLKAADRGVKIRILIDYMWSTKDPDRLAWNAGYLPNVEIKLYRPMTKRLNPTRPEKLINLLTPNDTNQRMHNKVMVVDGVIGMTGGRNIGNNYFDYSTKYNFKDREIFVMGPVVGDMVTSFDKYWKYRHSHFSHELIDVKKRMDAGIKKATWRQFDLDTPYFHNLDRLSDDERYIAETFIGPSMEADRVNFVADAPGKKTRFYFFNPRGGGAATEEMRRRFRAAKSQVLIQSPYVILNRRTRRIMKNAKQHAPNLRVKVSTNSFGAADHLETYSANFRLRTKVIRGLGFGVYEYQPHPEDLEVYLANFDSLKERADAEDRKRTPYLSIHSKTFVFDHDVAYIGTYNLDPRSFYINGECGIYVHDTDVASDVAHRLLRDMEPGNSWVINQKERPLAEVNFALEGISGLLPIDLWPVRYTSSFELKEGMEPVPPKHPEFYNRYRDLGSFPGSEGLTLEKTLTRVYKNIGKTATPLL